MEQTLEKENRLFENHLSEWRSTHLGEYVLIKDDQVLGFFPSLSEAFEEGTKRFSLASFFVKQIVPDDAVNVSFLGRTLRSASNS